MVTYFSSLMSPESDCATTSESLLVLNSRLFHGSKYTFKPTQHLNQIEVIVEICEIIPYISSCVVIARNRSGASPTPPRRTYCFGCYGARESIKKGKSNEVHGAASLDEAWWGSNQGILTGFSTFSVEAQRRRLKRALEEEERASKETEKVVRWAKQASARIDTSTVND
ncbi:hypothetical protein GW17_00018224 [Ensete ventricosum]|nr:hypothetical protein GW17_00018224 [Ensete ventricosum]